MPKRLIVADENLPKDIKMAKITNKSKIKEIELKFKFGILILYNSTGADEEKSTQKVNQKMTCIEALKKYDERIIKLTLFQVPMIDKIPVKLSNLKEIIICSAKGNQVSWLPSLLTQNHNTLESITLECVQFNKLKCEKDLKLSSLKSLNLIRCEGDHSNMLSGCTPKLKMLEIRCAEEKRLEGIKKLSVWRGKLTHLCLFDCWDVGAVNVILENSAATLQQLILHNVDLTNTKIFSNLPKVKSAVIRLCRFEDNNICFSEWRSLESLDIQYTRDHTLEGENLPKLKNLKIECAGALYEEKVDYRDDIGEIDDYHKDEEGEIDDLDRFLESCHSLETLTLKNMGRRYIINDGTDDDWEDEDQMESLPLKTITIESCTLGSTFSKHLLSACKLTLQSLVLKDVNTSAFINMNQIKFSKLKKLVILSPRYPSPRLRSVRAPVNQGIVDLLLSCNNVNEELEVDSLLDIYDLKELQSTNFPKLKVKIKDKHMYSKMELDMVHSIFLK